MNMQRRAMLGGILAAPAVMTRAVAGVVSSPASPVPVPAPLVDGAVPRWQRFAVAAPPPAGRPVITIIIDDMGVMHPGTPRAVALPGPLTLSWFPFARDLPDQVGAATARGHETLLHMPMQAFGNSTAWTGPDPLRVDVAPAENLRRLVAAMDTVPDTVGLNNHMGSVATRDVALMKLVADEARRRDMLFLDSLTIGHSVAYQQAALAGVPAAKRDVFIDDTNNVAMIQSQLALTERIARQEGNAIAIGHPRVLTLDALEAWLPGLAAKGFALWPLSATVAARNNIAMPKIVA
jgi:polysaccharide deacetylase 2 family uncharacterized protein YibQ